MIRIYAIDATRSTPFEHEGSLEYFRRRGISVVEDSASCDLVISSSLHALYRYIFQNLANGSLLKRYLLWSKDPQENAVPDLKTGGILLPTIHVMSAFTGDTWLNNYCEDDSGSSCSINQLLEPIRLENNFTFKSRKIAVFQSNSGDRSHLQCNWTRHRSDLRAVRDEIIVQGQRQDAVNVYKPYCTESLLDTWDKKWTLVERSNSLKPNISMWKEEVLHQHHFSLCLETNTLNFYCTNQIWDSIRRYCLPIYYGEGNRIYDDFPKNSFLDYSQFGSPEALFDYINRLDEKRFIRRMNACIEAYNTICQRQNYHRAVSDRTINENRLLRIVDRVYSIVGVGQRAEQYC